MIREANIPGQEAQALASLIALAMTWMLPLVAVLAAWAIALAAPVGGPWRPGPRRRAREWERQAFPLSAVFAALAFARGAPVGGPWSHPR